MGEYVYIEGERTPHYMYKPFIYKTVIDNSNHFIVYGPNRGDVCAIRKEMDERRVVNVRETNKRTKRCNSKNKL